MSEANNVLQEVRVALAETEDLLRRHAYLAAVAGGKVSEEALRAFPGHQYHIWQSDMRSAANLVARFGDRPYGGVFNDDLQAQIAAREQIALLAAKLGMTIDDLEAFEPTVEGFAYAAYFAWLSVYGSAAEVTCGLSANLVAWGHNCGVMSRGLREHYGFSQDDTAFLDGFENLPPFEDAALTVVQDDLERGVEPRQIVRAARLIQGYEMMFWDAMAAAAA